MMKLLFTGDCYGMTDAIEEECNYDIGSSLTSGLISDAASTGKAVGRAPRSGFISTRSSTGATVSPAAGSMDG